MLYLLQLIPNVFPPTMSEGALFLFTPRSAGFTTMLESLPGLAQGKPGTWVSSQIITSCATHAEMSEVKTF